MTELISREDRLRMNAEQVLRTAIGCRCGCHHLRAAADWCGKCRPNHVNEAGGIKIYKAKHP